MGIQEGKVPTIFIDGEAGTTGLGIRQRLEHLGAVTLLSIPDADRKNPAERQKRMQEADLVILCLPDAASREAVELAAALGPDAPRILDASTAYRTDPDWVFGFPELTGGQAARIRAASRVSNPGCYSTGAIALLRPLIEAGLIAPHTPLTINAVSGYSGGGRTMIEAHEAEGGPAFELYALSLAHKHVPEIEIQSGLTRRAGLRPLRRALPPGHAGLRPAASRHTAALPDGGRTRRSAGRALRRRGRDRGLGRAGGAAPA